MCLPPLLLSPWSRILGACCQVVPLPSHLWHPRHANILSLSHVRCAISDFFHVYSLRYLYIVDNTLQINSLLFSHVHVHVHVHFVSCLFYLPFFLFLDSPFHPPLLILPYLSLHAVTLPLS